MCTIRLHSPSICIGHVAAFGKTSMRCASLPNHSTTIKNCTTATGAVGLVHGVRVRYVVAPIMLPFFSSWRPCGTQKEKETLQFFVMVAVILHGLMTEVKIIKKITTCSCRLPSPERLRPPPHAAPPAEPLLAGAGAR